MQKLLKILKGSQTSSTEAETEDFSNRRLKKDDWETHYQCLITSNTSLSHGFLLNLKQTEVKEIRISRYTTAVLDTVTDIKCVFL